MTTATSRTSHNQQAGPKLAADNRAADNHAEQNRAGQAGLSLSDIGLEVTDGAEKRQVLAHVSLHISPGELVGITGPSGSGKSTLLSVAGCLQEPTTGTATLTVPGADRPLQLTGHSAREAARIRREHIGIVFQQPNLLPALKVKDQLMAMLHLGSPWPIGRTAKKAGAQRADELLDAVGLGGMQQRKVGELSGGQQARVNLARALMNSPQLLLVDEPTAALDQVTATQVTELIRQMARESNAATLYVSHDQEQLATLDRVLTLVDGEITEES